MDVNFYKKLINISFAVPIHKVDSTGLKFKGYRLALQFSAVREITICPDFSETEHLLLIRYKSPPQLWEAFPKMVYGKLTLNLADCREWSRELGISDECTLKLTKNHMKNACVLAVGLPKRPPLPADAAPYEKRNSEANEGLKIVSYTTVSLLIINAHLGHDSQNPQHSWENPSYQQDQSLLLKYPSNSDFP